MTEMDTFMRNPLVIYGWFSQRRHWNRRGGGILPAAMRDDAMKLFSLFVLSSCGLFACSDKGGQPGTVDAAVTPDAYASTCGHPGDLGNELGIGKFCERLSDCSGTAGLCSVLGDPTTHFCTKTCSATGPADQCGTATQCECNASNQCGCTPSACLAP